MNFLCECFCHFQLLFPPQIAWQCISYAAKLVKYLEKSWNGNEATKMTISERARLQYFRAGQFLRWMLETKMATIVDEKVKKWEGIKWNYELCCYSIS